MSKKADVPTYDFFKKLDSGFNLEYSKLEKAYNPYDASSAHRHDYFEMIIFNDSGGTHEVDFNSHKIKKNSIHFISPGQVHLLRRDKNVTGHVLSFKEDIFLPNQVSVIDTFHFFDPYHGFLLELDKTQKQKIETLVNNFTDEYSSDHQYKSHTLSAYLLILLIEITKIYSLKNNEKKSSSSGHLTDRFRKLVESNFQKIHSVSEYASMLNITPGHLNDTIKKESGKSASEIIHERLILEAKRMLYHSSKSIKEISNGLNYDDPSYFIRFFKTHTDQTPSEFRDQIRNKYH
jgi:AraC-like DNA-binding protein